MYEIVEFEGPIEIGVVEIHTNLDDACDICEILSQEAHEDDDMYQHSSYSYCIRNHQTKKFLTNDILYR